MLDILFSPKEYEAYNEMLSKITAPFIKVKDQSEKRGSNKIKPKKKRK